MYIIKREKGYRNGYSLVTGKVTALSVCNYSSYRSYNFINYFENNIKNDFCELRLLKKPVTVVTLLNSSICLCNRSCNTTVTEL